MASSMEKILSVTASAMLIAGLAISPASAKKRQRDMHTQSQKTTGAASPMVRGNNAALLGNNGNSGQGDNSLGHIKGGNIGGGK